MYKISTSTFTCGECPEGYLFNEITENCDITVLTAACPEGYTYNPNTGNCEGPSPTCPIDLAIVIDTSSSIVVAERTDYINFLLQIIIELEGGPLQRISGGDISVALVDFDNTASIILALSNNVAAINAAINALVFGGGTNTVGGLAKGWDALVPGTGANKRILLVTDGVPNYGTPIGATEGYCFTTADYNTGSSPCPPISADSLENCDFVYGTLALARDIRTGNYITKSVALYTPASVNVTLASTNTLVAGMMISIVSGAGTLGVGNTYVKRVINSTDIEISIAPSVAFNNTTVLGFGLNTAGDTAAITLAAVGSTVERQYTLQALLNGSLNISAGDCSLFSGPNGCSTTDTTLYPLPSLKVDNTPDYYDSSFTGANLIAASITESLCTESVSTLCNPDCAVVVIQNKPYCECVEELDIFPCCYALQNCTDPLAALIYTQTDLSEYEGQVITLVEFPGDCFEFEKIDGICEDGQVVTVSNSFPDCPTCKPSYKIYNCQDKSIFYYTESDLSDYVNPSKVVNLVEFPNTCWEVGINSDFPYVPISVTVDGPAYESCEDCIPKYYQLTNCVNPEIVILTDTDVTQYIGKIVQIDGYSGLCWTVSEPTCDCINVQIKGLSLFDGPVVSTSSSNGKPIYYFTIAGDDFTIAWDSNVNRWELYNITTSTVESYINTESDCPFSSNWSNEGDYTVVSITPCITDIYSVNISSSYPDCPCCTNKNCR